MKQQVKVLTFSSGIVGVLITFLLELIPRSERSSESSSRYNGKLSFLPFEVLWKINTMKFYRTFYHSIVLFHHSWGATEWKKETFTHVIIKTRRNLWFIITSFKKFVVKNMPYVMFLKFDNFRNSTSSSHHLWW